MLGTRITAIAAAVGAVGLLAALCAAPAAAHERRSAGGFQFVVGFGTEPAYAGDQNSVQVRIADAAGRPVTDLRGDLEVEVTQGRAAPVDVASSDGAGERSLGAAIVDGLVKGMNEKAAVDSAAAAALEASQAPAAQAGTGQAGPGRAAGDGGPGPKSGLEPKLTLPLEPGFRVGGSGEPGDYRAWFVPTEPGAYSFHLVGSIHGRRVDQRFSSSSKTFDDVADPSTAQFPVKQPSGSQLSGRIDREVPRLSAALAASQRDAARAQRAAGTARLIAILGLALGLLGLAATRSPSIRRRLHGARRG